MSIPLDVNGVVFQYPVTLDEDWGEEATAWAQAVTDGMLQMQGGSFPITADVNFGPNFGLLSKYFSTRSANPSTVGTIRLSSADLGIGWRNNANSGNLILTTNASDQLLYNGFPIATSGGGAVISITGTANQIIASSPTGAVTLSTPQDIAPTSSPTFASLTLTTPLSVANGGTGTATSTGTGDVVLSTGPTLTTPTLNSANLITPALGTPSSGTLTNCTGLPIDAGTTGTLPVLRGGTGTTTSTGTGSVVLSNSPTLVTPALGTPSAIILTNGTGLPIDAGTINTLPVSRGGTGATSFTAYAVLTGGTTSTNPVQAIASVGTFGQVLTSNGAGALPTFQNTTGSGTVNTGTANNVAYYPSTGTTVDDTTAFVVGSAGPNGIVRGTNTNDSAAAGEVGELISSFAADIASPGTSSYFDVTSIVLTAGDWDVVVLANFNADVTTAFTRGDVGFSTTPGNSSSGLVTGDNYVQCGAPSGAAGTVNYGGSIPTYRVSLAGTTTYYLKVRLDFTGSTPSSSGRISARRVR